MKEQNKNIGLILGTIFIATLGKNFFVWEDSIYFISQAVAWLLMSLYIYRVQQGYSKLLGLLMVLLNSFNVLDEIFLEAWKMSADKYAVGVLCFTYVGVRALQLYMKEHNYSFQHFRK